MTRMTKFFAATGLALTMGGMASAQEGVAEDGNVASMDLVGVTCMDFMEADAAAQMDYADAFGVMNAADVELSADAAADVDTIDDDVQAIAAACEGNEAIELLDLEVVGGM
ncbi:HdeA/HdeB family chaperone [Wenxinia marina]|uniref:HdeA/HdeB family protein n=1 Tax=Wenxinia marina DSM 24838 TaxID=1123501 RepID=A0A0D0NLB6_9RHOB|nr:HdeA/HdeB family chaperone [Wenxinia marina]KIQ69095.1 hypothetical protein Wenmar_02163 [Wenxinia marina DSM 24838]GGL70238.1 hypothetical protein GCM10011392_26050 [Wenxinia marina]